MKTEKYYLGIDPGLEGAACLLSDGFIKFYDWPKSDLAVDVFNIIKNWNEDYNICGAFLEKIGTIGIGGKKSNFKFGTYNGYWEMILIALDIRFFRPLPKDWQKGIITRKDGATPKERSYKIANQIYPFADLSYLTPKNIKIILDGRCDALLMAHQARKFFT